MSDSDRRNTTALRTLSDALIWVAVCLLAVFLFADIYTRITADRAAVDQAAQIGCEKGERDACDGSYAEVRAANAAEQMVDLTMLQFLAGIVGVVLVGFTLKATRDAVREANDASNAAREAIDVTREGMHRQLRAYITVKNAAPFDPSVGTQPGGLITLVNSGQTPAYELRALTAMRLRPPGQHRPLTDPDFSECGAHIIGAGGEYELQPSYEQTLTFAEEGQVWTNKMAIYVYGIIAYRDAFGASRTTKLAFESVSIPRGAGKKLVFKPCIQGNEAD